jgi:lipoprotein-releasing system permease protein
LKLSGFISGRITSSAAGFSAVIHRIAIISIAVGLAAMIVAFLVMKGFQTTVQEKIYSFSAHLLVNRITEGNSMEEPPFNFRISLYNHPDSFPDIAHVQEYSHKAGLIKTDAEITGILLKGVGRSFSLERFRDQLKEGSFLSFPDSGYSNQIVISRLIAEKLNVKTGDQLTIHFFQNPPRARRLTISGIYETNLSDYFDEKIILCDLALIQRLNGWSADEAGGLQIFLKDADMTWLTYMNLMDKLPYDLYVEPTSNRYIQIFEWLNLITRQVNILLVVILMVVCVNMISVVLILVMERTNMIGILKALGAGNPAVRNIFIRQGINLVLRGLLIGNIFGLGLCWLQHRFRIITLDARNYYMDYVPVYWDWQMVITLNVLVFAVVSVVLILPVMVISRIRPVTAIRFD